VSGGFAFPGWFAVLAFAALTAALPGVAAAESYVLRWRAPADVAHVTGYRAYIGTAGMSRAVPVELGLVAPGRDGILRAAVSGFDASGPSTVELTAVGPGGESVLSNALEIWPSGEIRGGRGPGDACASGADCDGNADPTPAGVGWPAPDTDAAPEEGRPLEADGSLALAFFSSRAGAGAGASARVAAAIAAEDPALVLDAGRRGRSALESVRLAERSYSFDVGGVHCVALAVPPDGHANPDGARGRAMLAWLRADLARARGAPFVVVYLRGDLYAANAARRLPAHMRAALVEIFDEAGVSLVLSAANPGFERSHPLRAGAPQRRTAASAERRPLEPIDAALGTVYLRAGAGRRRGQRRWRPRGRPDWLAARDARMDSFVLLDPVGADQLLVSVLGVAEAGLPVVELDAFVLRRRGG
jgi:hypothetical protein